MLLGYHVWSSNQQQPTSSIASSDCCEQQVQEQVVVSPRLAAVSLSIRVPLYYYYPPTYNLAPKRPFFLPQRYRLQAHYDSGVAGAVAAAIGAAVIGDGAAVATAVDYYQDSTDGTGAVACAAFEAGSPSAATIKIHFKQHHTTTIWDYFRICRSGSATALTMFVVGKSHYASLGSPPDSHVSRKCSFRCLLGQQAN